MSDPEQDPDPGDPLNYAPRRLREQNDRTDPATVELEKVEKALSALRAPYENLPPLAPSIPPLPSMRGQDLRPDPRSQHEPNIFAEALARAEREQLERELIEAPAFLPRRRSLHIVTKFVIAVAVAALAALTYVVAFPTSPAPFEDIAQLGLPTLRELRASLFPASLPKPAPTLMVRDNSGSINELLEFGVSVIDATPGMSVIIKKMLPGTKLTAGAPAGPTEWRVPAQDISDAVITPPTDFVGEMNLSAELRGADGATLVTAFVRLTWAAPSVRAVVAAAAAVPTPTPAVAPEQPPQVVAPPPPATAEVARPPARTEPIQDLSPNEIAGLVRRAQDLLASGDLQAARLQLMRAASARDPRAALLLAKTFDPIVLRQYGATDPESDLAQARNWYQRAREWGSPEAQRQLDALASYPRR